MALRKKVRMSNVRHKDVCGLLKKWRGVAKGSVTSEDCQEVCECMCLGLCLCMYAFFHTYNHTHTLTCARTRIHAHLIAGNGMLTSRWVGQEMLAFLRRLTCVKPTPASTPSTLSSKTRVCSDGAPAAGAEANEGGGVRECIKEADMQQAVAREEAPFWRGLLMKLRTVSAEECRQVSVCLCLCRVSVSVHVCTL
jgi:hypothetical protein